MCVHTQIAANYAGSIARKSELMAQSDTVCVCACACACVCVYNYVCVYVCVHVHSKILC